MSHNFMTECNANIVSVRKSFLASNILLQYLEFSHIIEM